LKELMKFSTAALVAKSLFELSLCEHFFDGIGGDPRGVKVKLFPPAQT
jgi:hypothetical protein